MFAGFPGELTLTRRALTPAQTQAIIANAVVTYFNPEHSNTARAVERKKPGRPKARKKFQFSKR